MKIADFNKVQALMRDRAELANQMKCVADPSSEALGITIFGRYQSTAMLAAVRPYVVAVLKARIDNIDHDLQALGVDTDEPA